MTGELNLVQPAPKRKKLRDKVLGLMTDNFARVYRTRELAAELDEHEYRIIAICIDLEKEQLIRRSDIIPSCYYTTATLGKKQQIKYWRDHP